MSKQYFYEENGKLKRYSYCSLCGKGPFKEEDIVDDNVSPDKLLYVAGQTASTRMFYCYTCNNYVSNSSPKKELKTFFNFTDVKDTIVKQEVKVEDTVIKNDIKEELPVEEEIVKEEAKSLSQTSNVNEQLNDIDYSNLLFKETKGQISTSLIGEWSIIILKSNDDFLYCTSVKTDPVQFVNDYNNKKAKIQGVNITPLEIVYIRRTEKESDAKLIEYIIKKRPKPFKQKLIENYKKTVGGTK